jgi:hypothetical protein
VTKAGSAARFIAKEVVFYDTGMEITTLYSVNATVQALIFVPFRFAATFG